MQALQGAIGHSFNNSIWCTRHSLFTEVQKKLANQKNSFWHHEISHKKPWWVSPWKCHLGGIIWNSFKQKISYKQRTAWMVIGSHSVSHQIRDFATWICAGVECLFELGFNVLQKPGGGLKVKACRYNKFLGKSLTYCLPMAFLLLHIANQNGELLKMFYDI